MAKHAAVQYLSGILKQTALRIPSQKSIRGSTLEGFVPSWGHTVTSRLFRLAVSRIDPCVKEMDQRPACLGANQLYFMSEQTT